MLGKPERQEINEHTGKLIVGVIAILLASVTDLLAGGGLESISESYHKDGLSRDVFVGSLLAISAFLAAYNGHSKPQMILSKVAAIAAIGIAFVPCLCPGSDDPRSSWIHGFSAAVMFLVLAFFCRTFYDRAKAKIKEHPKAKLRSRIYALCGYAIVISILILGIDGLFDNFIKNVVPNLTFIFEAVGLGAFGIAWLTASRIFFGITDPGERIRPFS